MKEKDLKQILREDFNFEKNWKPLFSMLFNKIQYFSNPSNPFEEHSKVKSGKQTGIVKLDDGKSLAIFEVEVDDSIKIDRNRQGLREIAIKHIDQNITHGALVFFYSKNQADYRFSFIAKWSEIDLETGDFIKGETKPKRYTYLLGDNEACTTAAKRLLILARKKEAQEIGIQEVIDAFAVEPLKNDFFKTYKEHYERFWRYIANEENGCRQILLDTSKETIEQQEKPIRDFVKKLLGRIVFLHFLQKKGWMGCPANKEEWIDGDKKFMQNLFNEFQNKSKFHSKCLTKLFFNTLNTIRENDVLEIDGLKGKLNGSRVPYLNGGLFDVDKPEETQHIDFPEKFFFELLDFFEQYNFTIDENSPDDHEVGIDPEMLGHIFENLLEENREKGAFYTPKEVVQYMCKESIIQYLNNHFDVSDDIENFIRNHVVSKFFTDRDNAIELNDKLSAIKVCDPAIGSGAFPIGMLQEIFEAKKFIYPYLKTNKEFNPAQVKKNIIQNSIYGVDLEKGAVDIAQLRFWLALVVDETKPSPLPNLDYKIMQGNSLLESYEGIDLSKAALFEEPNVTIVNPTLFEEPKTEYGFSEEIRKDIKQLISNYFKEEDKDQKQQIRKSIDRIVLDHIDKSLEFHENRLLIEIADFEKRLENKTERLTDKQKEQYVAKSKEVKEIDKRKKQLANRTEARKKLLDFENTDERPYFLWHLFFMDVFEQGGFDVMIGNPPYIKEYTNRAAFDGFRESKYYQGKMDLWYGFACNTLDLLKPKGVQSFIAQNNWTTSAGASNLRKKIFSENKLCSFMDFGNYKVFRSAGIQTMIYLIQKTKPTSSYQIKYSHLLNEIIDDKELAQFLNFEIKNEFSEKYWFELIPQSEPKNSFTFNANDDEKLLNQIAKKANYHLSDKEVAQGIVPNPDVINNRNIKKLRIEKIHKYGIKSGDGVFVVKKGIFENLSESEEKYLKPIFEPNKISKYKFIDDYESEIIYITKANYQNDAPKLIQHLEKFREIMDDRRENINGRLEFFHLHWPRDEYYFSEGAKILCVRKCDKPTFIYTEKPSFVMMSFNIIKTKKLNAKYLVTILNSKLIEYWLRNKGKMQGNNFQIDKEPLINLPLVTTENIKPFEIIADYLICLNDPKQAPVLEKVSNEAVSQFFEDVLNMMVYELYFEKHMKENEIDILKFVDFEDISQLESFEEKRNVIQKEYYKLKEKDNPIRNRILLSSTRSPNIIKRINESTH